MSENILRDKMENYLKHRLRVLALKTRSDMGLTQRVMSERYIVAENSYSALETGEYMCGTLTTILLLADQKDLILTINEIMTDLEKIREEELMTIC